MSDGKCCAHAWSCQTATVNLRDESESESRLKQFCAVTVKRLRENVCKLAFRGGARAERFDEILKHKHDLVISSVHIHINLTPGSV